MKKKTSADYQREFRQRLREQGLKKKEVWIRPEHEKLLADIEAQLRHPTLGKENTMDSPTARWQTDLLCQQLQQQPLFAEGHASAEFLPGSHPSIFIVLHDYGDLPVYLAVAGEQILVESVLFPASLVKNSAAFNLAVLETHKYFPLSTISVEYTQDGDAYYNMFGSLSASEQIESIVLEIETLASNVLQAVEAYRPFLKEQSQ
ncbi:YjfI family protein [Suttonella ornithocola]|uniref:Uncharacterized protein conserved in bacteria n=1 Tax=Suttonella ornithocola TaxID=279832 RepID=A0A380MVM9_9GAMM|nr:YjfI family protein [Suttonella ornithocola]SUO96332.1 Uncharacterized protein conserved in bacteria [Suttonella ornithocola]